MKDEPVEIFHWFNKLKHSVIAQSWLRNYISKLIFSSPFSNIFSLDRDVAELYGVTTKVVNQAIRNNPDKFPSGYVIELTNSEKEHVVKNFDHLETLKFSHATVKGFTEQGLYMLATI